MQWYKQIRLDLLSRVSEEPPEASVDVVHVRVRLPDGGRVSRRFSLSQEMEVRVSFSL